MYTQRGMSVVLLRLDQLVLLLSEQPPMFLFQKRMQTELLSGLNDLEEPEVVIV